MTDNSFGQAQDAKHRGIFPIKHFIKGQSQDFTLDKKTPWVQRCLNELILNLEEEDKQKGIDSSVLHLNLKIIRKSIPEYDDVFLLTGDLKLSFLTYCVKSMQLMPQDLSVPLKCCFIHESFQEKEEYADVIEIFVEGDMQELFFYTDTEIDLMGCVMEIIEVHKNPYPTMIEENSNEIHENPPTNTKQ
jgi:hypothetical protein